MNKILRKLKRWITGLAKKHSRLMRILRFLRNLYSLVRYKIQTFYIKTDPKMVIFASFEGRSYSDNPKALFEYMVGSGKYNDYTYVWGFRGDISGKQRLFDERFPDCHIEVVSYGSREWRKNTARAGYWIFNYKIGDSIKPKADQIFLQTWHGTPLKRLGHDLEHFDNALNSKEGIQKRYDKEVLKFTYFISPSPFATEKFKSAWRMDDFGKSDVMLEVGYPRNDALIDLPPKKMESLRSDILGDDYKRILGKRILLYAPTFRSNQHESGLGYTYKEETDFGKLYKRLGSDFIILYRAHYFVANKFDFKKYDGFVYDVSSYEDINDLYIISDMLITDYSSSMFDYADLKRPMIFYMYDLDHYRDESNGFYFDPYEVLPGPIVKNDDELIDAVIYQNENFKYDDKYINFNAKFNPWDDGHVSERVIKKVFGEGK